MDLIQQSFNILYPNKQYKYQSKLTYSNRFSDYNANIKLTSFNQLELNISKKWRGVNSDITIGLIQSLMLKLFKDKQAPTINIELYNLFIKNLHISAPKSNINSDLAKQFHKLNHGFFNGQLETPNLQWGPFSTRKLGSYDFQTDTISISKALQNVEEPLLQYVIYHEMLHKHFKFKSTPNRQSFHSREFRAAEKIFPNAEILEKKLRYLPRTPKKPSFLMNFMKLFSFP